MKESRWKTWLQNGNFCYSTSAAEFLACKYLGLCGLLFQHFLDLASTSQLGFEAASSLQFWYCAILLRHTELEFDHGSLSLTLRCDFLALPSGRLLRLMQWIRVPKSKRTVTCKAEFSVAAELMSQRILVFLCRMLMVQLNFNFIYFNSLKWNSRSRRSKMAAIIKSAKAIWKLL